jgi:hypothetical protein
MNRRTEITMSADEVDIFLAQERIVTCASLGRSGRPHLMPLWYVVRDGTIWAWTYRRSQKVRNLERDPRATLLIEAGAAVYGELRGVMLEVDTTIHDAPDMVAGVGVELAARYGGAEITPQLRDSVLAQAPKRVALEFHETARVTWDHRKLADAQRRD